jgi:hypothetical protein
MTIQTRKPTGLPPWPIILLAGLEKTGKSYAAAVASSSPLVGRTLWVGIGEDDPDEYGQVPGANFDIVVHDGTFDGILRAAKAVAAEPPVDGKPTLFVVDSMTNLWNLCVDNVQAIANQRSSGNRGANGEKPISPDLWNAAAANWAKFMDAIRAHRGPTIVTARLDEVMVMGDDGKPTKQKRMKVQAHKTLPYDVGVVVELHERGHALIKGVRSVKMALEREEEIKGGISIPALWDRLGLSAKAGTSDRVHAGVVIDDVTEEGLLATWSDKAVAETTLDGIRALWQEANVLVKQGALPTSVLDRITLIGSDLKAKQTPPPLPGTAVSPPEKREWVKEAEGRETAASVRELAREAEALGADAEVLVRIEAIAALKPGAEGEQAEGTWAKPEGAPDDWNQPAVLGEGDEKPEPPKKSTKAAAAKPAPEAEPAPAGPAAAESEEEQPF